MDREYIHFSKQDLSHNQCWRKQINWSVILFAVHILPVSFAFQYRWPHIKVFIDHEPPWDVRFVLSRILIQCRIFAHTVHEHLSNIVFLFHIVSFPTWKKVLKYLLDAKSFHGCLEFSIIAHIAPGSDTVNGIDSWRVVYIVAIYNFPSTDILLTKCKMLFFVTLLSSKVNVHTCNLLENIQFELLTEKP